MNRANWLRGVGCALVLAMLAACATRVTYDGQRLQASEEALLSGGKSPETGGAVTIIVADGQLYYSGGFSRGVGATRLYLKPGRHSVTVAHNHYGWEARAELWFEAAAGGKYLARAVRQNGGLRIWIEDSATGKMVGGVDDNPTPLFSIFKKD